MGCGLVWAELIMTNGDRFKVVPPYHHMTRFALVCHGLHQNVMVCPVCPGLGCFAPACGHRGALVPNAGVSPGLPRFGRAGLARAAGGLGSPGGTWGMDLGRFGRLR